jgi:hypothetical protein
MQVALKNYSKHFQSILLFLFIIPAFCGISNTLAAQDRYDFNRSYIASTEVSAQAMPVITDELRAHPSSIVFNGVKGHPLNDTRSIFIFTTLEESISWKQSADVAWLTADIQNGMTEDILKVGVNSSGLEPGIYYGTITIESSQSSAGPVIIPVSLIINPDVPVTMSVWKDGRAAAMSVSVDDGQPSGFDELQMNGFQGTYVSNSTSPPSFYTGYYNAGMELGSHLVSHPCYSVSDDVLRSYEIQPNVLSICSNTPIPCHNIVSLVWPCGFTNYREQAVASEFFISARGYNINMLEDATPDNFMNLKSYNSHEHTPYPPYDLKKVVDTAVILNKWFNLVLHGYTNDDGAITYSRSKDIWVAPIGDVIKYILQRDRFILTDYSESSDKIMYKVSRLPVPSTVSKNFEMAFGPDDLTTMQIDIDDSRIVVNVLVNGAITPFQTKDLSGNKVILTNVRLQPDITKTVEIIYLDRSVPVISLNTSILNFNALEGNNPANQYLILSTNVPDPVNWTATITNSQPSWLSINPNSNLWNDTLMISVNSTGLPAGNYNKTITISSPEAYNSPLDVNVTLEINPSRLHQNHPNPFISYTWIEFDLYEDSHVELEVYNSSGQKIETILSQYMRSDSYRFKWESRNYPSGKYYLSLKTKAFTETIKMLLLK